MALNFLRAAWEGWRRKMAIEVGALQIEGLSLEVPPSGVEMLLNRTGISLRLTGLSVRLPQRVLDSILARVAPDDDPEALQARLLPKGIVIDRIQDGKSLHLEVALGEVRLHLGGDEIRLEGD